MVIRLFCAHAVQVPVEDVILPAYIAESGAGVEATFGPSSMLARALRSGAEADLIVAIDSTISALVGEGLVARNSVLPLVSVGLGLGVPAGTQAKPPVNRDELVDLVVNARSVAYSSEGASGIYFAELIETWGATARVNSTATIVDRGLTGVCLVDGRSDLAIQQYSELLAVPGITVMPFPLELQHYTKFAVACTNSKRGSDLEGRLETLRSGFWEDEARACYAKFGLSVI